MDADTFADDMPAVSDARRVVRLAMMLDELRFIAKMYKQNKTDQIRTHLTDGEFFVCGGKAVAGMKYSFYRQLVYAKRDAAAFASRRIFPCAAAAKRAISLYRFYDTDDEAVDDASNMSKDIGLLKISFVLKRFRKFARQYPVLASDEARLAFLSIGLTKDEFVRCAGHKTVSKTLVHSFYRQVVLAKRDMENILNRGRFPKSMRKSMPSSISSDEDGNAAEEEDVDDLDGDAAEGTALSNADEVDDEDDG